MNSNFLMQIYLLFLFIFVTTCFNLTCNGRGFYNKITINNNLPYTPQYYITFGILLKQQQQLSQNVSVSITASKQCLPDSNNFNFKFTESECKSFLKGITCGRKIYLNCSKEYKLKDTEISFTALGYIQYQGQSINCTDSGQVVEWRGSVDPQNTTNIWLIIGVVAGGILIIVVGVFAVWKCKKGKKDTDYQAMKEQTSLVK